MYLTKRLEDYEKAVRIAQSKYEMSIRIAEKKRISAFKRASKRYDEAE